MDSAAENSTTTDVAPVASDRRIVLGIDRNYLLQAATMLTSLSAASSRAIPTTLLHSDLTSSEIRALERLSATMGWPLDVKQVVVPSGLPVTDWVTPATYIRLFAPVFCADTSYVLYLDVDMLVLEDLAPLVNITPHSAVAAVQDHFHPTFETSQALPGYRSGASSRTPYFNAGVLLASVKDWDKMDVTERALRFLYNNPDHIRFWDQDALNAVLEQQWEPLAPEWNCFPFRDLLGRHDWRKPGQVTMPLNTLFDLEDRARILHFAGPKKPWQEAYRQSSSRRLYRSMFRVAQRLVEEVE
jgi:lipopolysaccharide biosynthesis glycosyltransferase